MMMMMMGNSMAPSMQLGVSAELEEAVREAAERQVVGVKVVIDAKRPRLVAEATTPPRGTPAESFQEVFGLLEDEKPCIILLRVQDCFGQLEQQGEGREAAEVDWLLLSWTPEGAPPKEKMRYACCKKTLRENFEGLRFKEFFAEDRASLSLEAVLASCGPMSEEERDAVSTREERYARLVQQTQADAERAAAAGPRQRIDYGLRAPQVEASPSFDEAVSQLLTEAGQGVVTAQLTVVEGAHGSRDGRRLSGTVLPEATLGSGASGCDWLPAGAACYAVARLQDGRLLLLVWRPEGADPSDKVLYSASRAAVRLATERAAGDNRDVVVVEAADREELHDGLRGVGAEEAAAA